MVSRGDEEYGRKVQGRSGLRWMGVWDKDGGEGRCAVGSWGKVDGREA